MLGIHRTSKLKLAKTISALQAFTFDRHESYTLGQIAALTLVSLQYTKALKSLLPFLMILGEDNAAH